MSEKLLKILDDVREVYGKPIVINSGYRTEAHNAKVGGKMPDANGIGGSSHDTFIHIDVDDSKAQRVIWTY
jgi:uncharacterized protein YcbK (DUF882 family)